ncbi:TniB family NTP-binding protein [Streptomyces pseudovenezuelae]
METLLSWPSKQRMPNLLLIGPTNNGKRSGGLVRAGADGPAPQPEGTQG